MFIIMKSLFCDRIETTDFEPLQGDAKTDVLIIGGGMAGVLCAYFLQKAGVDYMLVEGKKIGGGITQNTTAKITSQHGLLYHKLLKGIGPEKSKMYLEANQQALKEYTRICTGIDCDFEEKDAYVYSADKRKVIEDELSALDRIGFKGEFADITNLPFKTAGAVKFSGQAQFHPLKFLAAIAKDLKIFEHTFVKELAPHTAFTENGKITAKQIIVASHFPFLNKHGGYFLKMYQHRSYAVALEKAADVGGMYLEEKVNGLSFRNYRNFLIISGGDHKTGKRGGNWQVLRSFAAANYPLASERYAWATQDCMTLDSVPYIGSYGKSTEGLYVVSGFNKWGMTSSMVAAQLLSDLLRGQSNPYAPVFSPQRSMLKFQLAVNGLAAVGNLLTPSRKRCPHLGCALKWNQTEGSWDCPCHGSRFNKDGLLIDNPATGGLKHYKKDLPTP